jgi:hypothetical protein
MDPSEAIETFKNYCDKYAMKFSDGSAVKVSQLGGGWAKERYLFEASEDIDVFQTSSLMYPYESRHQFVILREYTDFHQSMIAAENDSWFCKSDRTRHIHNYRLDKGFWMPTKRVHQMIYSQEMVELIGEATWYDCVQSEGDVITFVHQCTYGDE